MKYCRCHNLPKEGRFIIGKVYKWSYIIDATFTIDEDGRKIYFNDYVFLWYFTKLNDVTTEEKKNV